MARDFSWTALKEGSGRERERVILFSCALPGNDYFGLSTNIPNHQWWYAKWKLSWNLYTSHTRFGTFGANLYTQSVLI